MFAGGHNNYSYAIVLRRPVAAAMDRYLLPGRARSSKPARKLPQRTDRTDGRTDRRTLCRYTDLVTYCASSARNEILSPLY